MWSVEPGIDLSSIEAKLSRGAAESEFIGNYSRFVDTYAGFEKAQTSDIGSHVASAFMGKGLVGTLQWRLMSLVTTKDGFQSLSCLQVAGTATTASYPQYDSPRLGTIESTRTTFTREIGRDASPTVQSVPSAIFPGMKGLDPEAYWAGPPINIFSGWKIAVVNSDPGDMDRCRPWGYSLFPKPPKTKEMGDMLFTVRTTERPETLPSSPGW